MAVHIVSQARLGLWKSKYCRQLSKQILRPGSNYFVTNYPYSYPNQEFPSQLDCSVHKKVKAVHILSQLRLGLQKWKCCRKLSKQILRPEWKYFVWIDPYSYPNQEFPSQLDCSVHKKVMAVHILSKLQLGLQKWKCCRNLSKQILRPEWKYFVWIYPYSYPDQEFPSQLDCSVHKKVMAVHILSQLQLGLQNWKCCRKLSKQILRPEWKYFVWTYPYSYPNQEFPSQLDCSVHKKVMADHILSQLRLGFQKWKCCRKLSKQILRPEWKYFVWIYP